HEAERVRVGEQIALVRIGLSARSRGRAIEQGAERHTQGAGHLDQSTRADAIGAILVLLDLLEREADPLCELGLREALLHPDDSDVVSDTDIDGSRASFRLRHGNPLASLLREQPFRRRSGGTVFVRDMDVDSRRVLSMRAKVLLSRAMTAGNERL